MCAYSGGKARLGRKIYEEISKYETEHFGDNMSSYFEPFVGMGGVLQHFSRKILKKECYSHATKKKV